MENNQTTRTMAMEDLHLIRQVLDQTATSFQTLAPVFWRMGLVWLLYGVLAFFVNTSDFIGYYFPPLALPLSLYGLLTWAKVVLVVYLLNLAMVTANLFVYFRNCALDRKAELCAEPEADDTAMDLMAASVAEQVQQHDLEGAEEDEREGQPDHHARTPQRHAPHHVKSQRHQYQRLDRPDGVGFGIGQHAVGDNQRDEEIDLSLIHI